MRCTRCSSRAHSDIRPTPFQYIGPYHHLAIRPVVYGNRAQFLLVRDILKQHLASPTLSCNRQPGSWRAFLNYHRHQMLARDSFKVETIFSQTLYAIFFIEVSPRRIDLAGRTAHPPRPGPSNRRGISVGILQDGTFPVRFVAHDWDTKFCPAFDRVFTNEGVEIVLTPFRAPNANAFAERWVRSVREESLNHLLILSERHLRRVLLEYRDYFNYRRPHQGLAQQCPVLSLGGPGDGRVYRRDLLGGILHDYCREAA